MPAHRIQQQQYKDPHSFADASNGRVLLSTAVRTTVQALVVGPTDQIEANIVTRRYSAALVNNRR